MKNPTLRQWRQLRVRGEVIDTAPWSIPTATVEGSDFWNQMGYIFVISVVRGIPRNSQRWICKCGGSMVNRQPHGARDQASTMCLCRQQRLCSFSQSGMQITSVELTSLLRAGSAWVRGLSPRGSDLSDVRTGLSWCWIMHGYSRVVV